ncbi:MAG: PAS domain-containing protein, partial [Mycobacterium leprae]
MKKNLPVTQIERHYLPEERLISETDLRGIVTTANAAFCEVAGFTQAEMVGKSHNIVRHPDVPPAIFADLWRTLKAGERWVGVVKNRCKNGDYYWVKAFVSPVVQDGVTVRYRSVRVQPTRAEIAAAEEIYRRAHTGDQRAMDTLGSYRRRSGIGERLGLPAQLGLVAGWPLLLAVALLAASRLGIPGTLLWGVAGLGAVVTLLLTRLVYRWQTQPLAEFTQAVTAFEQGDLSARAEVYGRSGFANVARVMNRSLDGVSVALSDMGQVLDSLARGEFGRRIVATLPGELGRIKLAANHAVDQIESTVEALNAQLQALAEGRLDAHDQDRSDRAEGKFREAQENAATAAARLAALLTDMVESSRAMATGDLTRLIETEAAGELAVLRSQFNAALQALAETL